MKKYIPFLITILVLIVAGVTVLWYKNSSSVLENTKAPAQNHNRGDIANEKIEKIDGDWSRYTNSRIKLSFEFPSSILSLEPEGFYSYSNDVPSMRFTNRGNGENTKMTASIIMPTNANGMDSVEDWKKFIDTNGDLNKNLKYEIVDGVNVSISYVSDQEGINAYTMVNFFRNKQVNNITISGLSTTDTDRVVKSIHFF
jgi:hypothetical protein